MSAPEILASARPIGVVPVESRDRAIEVAIQVRDAGFGVAVIEDRSGNLHVLVVGDVGREAPVRKFVASLGGEVAADRHVEVARAFVPASWMTGMVLQRAEVGRRL